MGGNMVRNLNIRLVVTLCLLVTGAGTAIADEPEAIYRGTWEVVRYDVSPPLRDIEPVAIEPGLPYGGLMIDPESNYLGPLGPQDFDLIVQRPPGPAEIPAPLVSFDGPGNIAGRLAAGPGGRRRPGPLRGDEQPLLRDLRQGRRVCSTGPAANNTLWAGFRRRLRDGQRRRSDRALRPARRSLDPDPVHGLRPDLLQLRGDLDRPGPDRHLLPLRLQHRHQLPRLPEVRRLVGRLLHQHPRVRRVVLRRRRRLRRQPRRR